MIRITKLTDYGILVLTWFASREPETTVSGPELAERTLLPEPTVGKLLRLLTRANVLESRRGARGGYRLARPASEITVADAIEALEGPIALTECIGNSSPDCGVEQICPTRSNWDRINGAIRGALDAMTLADMAIIQPAELPPPPPGAEAETAANTEGVIR